MLPGISRPIQILLAVGRRVHQNVNMVDLASGTTASRRFPPSPTISNRGARLRVANPDTAQGSRADSDLRETRPWGRLAGRRPHAPLVLVGACLSVSTAAHSPDGSV